MRALVRCLAISGVVLFASGCALFAGRQLSGSGESSSYLIQSGDTLSALESRFNLPSGELQRVNNIKDPRKLQVGQIITIPALGPLDPGNARVHMLAKGDTAGLKRVSLTGVRSYRGNLALPVEVPRLSSSFGWRSGRFHEGLDLAAPEGTKILAAHEGTVVFVSNGFGGYGRVVAVRGKNLLTVYAHNSKNRVSTGDTIEKGDWIADVGQTGSASGPHLHFETRVKDGNGRFAAVDPLVFFPARRSSD